MSIEFNKNDLKKITEAFNDLKDISVVAKNVLNTTAKSVKVQTKKDIGKKLNLKARRINKDLSIEKATNQKWTSKVIASGTPIGLIQFAGKQQRLGVKVKVIREKGSKLLKHAFIENKGGKTHLWWRMKPKDIKKGKPGVPPKISKTTGLVYRLPIERLTGPRTTDILDDDDVLKPLIKKGGVILTENIDKEITKRLRKLNRG